MTMIEDDIPVYRPHSNDASAASNSLTRAHVATRRSFSGVPVDRFSGMKRLVAHDARLVAEIVGVGGLELERCVESGRKNENDLALS